MKRTATPTFVLSIPLVVKPGEDRILIGRMEAGRRLYNATLGEALRRHGLLKQSKDWQHTRTIADKKLRSDEFKRLSKEAGFTPAAIITFARTCKNEAGWKDRLGSNVTQRIAEQVFAAVQQYAFGKRGRPRFKGASRPCIRLRQPPMRPTSSGSLKRAVSSLATSRYRPCYPPKHKTRICTKRSPIKQSIAACCGALFPAHAAGLCNSCRKASPRQSTSRLVAKSLVWTSVRARLLWSATTPHRW
ncbi:MAG: hypothetical protein WJ289_09440 [Ferrovum myxofaciens]|uniref:hypothetical protein n=1 Tax=Ferrovum myxofaciens TaxID=416213 RepID=UPI003EB8166B